MAQGKRLLGATLDSIRDLLGETPGVYLRHLPSFTTVLVWTTNSLYRLVVTEWPEVYIQGGPFFPDPTSARIDGAGIGGSSVKVGWIGAGLPMEIRCEGRHIVTSPVWDITTEEGRSLMRLPQPE